MVSYAVYFIAVPIMDDNASQLYVVNEGTAVWCLASGATNAVEYHIDYAELYRYQLIVTFSACKRKVTT